MKSMCRSTFLYNSLLGMFCLLASVSIAHPQVVARVAPDTVPVRTSSAPARTPDTDRSVSHPATSIYRIGVGDVLYINIVSTTNARGYYPVRTDGTIDYPLAGDNVVAAGLTCEALERMLASSISLYREPKIEARIREYASHRIVISGLVSNGGVRYIQREALPLFVICADAEVNSKATQVIVRDGRTNAVRTYDLHNPNTPNIVINTGDELEFVGA